MFKTSSQLTLDSLVAALHDRFVGDCEVEVSRVSPHLTRMVLTRPAESVLITLETSGTDLSVVCDATDLGIARHTPFLVPVWKIVLSVVTPGSRFTWWAGLERDVVDFLQGFKPSGG